MESVLADINIADPTANVNKDDEIADTAPRAVQQKEKQQFGDQGSKEGQKSRKKEKKRKHADIDMGDTTVNRKKEKKKRRSEISSEA